MTECLTPDSFGDVPWIQKVVYSCIDVPLLNMSMYITARD